MSPIAMLNMISAEYRGIWQLVESRAVANIESNYSSWGSEIFLPAWDWAHLLLTAKNPLWHIGMKAGDALPLENVNFLSIAAIGAWRYTKGIYTVDKNISKLLLESDFNGKIPIAVLNKLPEWSIYIDTQDLQLLYDNQRVCGFWASINKIPTMDKCSLMLTVLFETGVTPRSNLSVLLDTENGLTIEEATKNTNSELRKNNVVLREHGNSVLGDINGFKKQALQLLLMVCQSEPDIFEKNEEVENFDFIPHPQRIKGKLRLFEAKRERHFDVGVRATRMIKAALTTYHDSGKTQAPHIRRAHWHGYWKGSRKDDAQEFFYKWIAPVIVNADLATIE